MAFGLFVDRLGVGTYELDSKPFLPSSATMPAAEPQRVCLWSNAMVSKPHDWRGQATIAGYSLPQHGDAYLPSERLQTFLSTKGPAVAISMGSMNIPDPAAFLCMVCEALADTGARAVVSGSWTKHLSASLQARDNVYAIDDIPHTWLLQRVQGFIHHGGAGHAAAGARAGVPMLILPFFIDQNFWAARCRQLRLGPAPIQFSNITAGGLGSAVADLLSGVYGEACSRMASQLAEDADGTGVAADVIAREIQASAATKPCSLVAGLTAQWRHTDSGLLLSGLAAAALASQKLALWSDYDMHPVVMWGTLSDDSKASLSGILKILLLKAFEILKFLLRILAWGEPSTAKTSSPVREAKIRQSIYDLERVRNGMTMECGEEQRWDEQQLIENWKVLVGLKGHVKLADNKD